LYLEAMELGAFDYFTYPYYRDGVEWVVGNALRRGSKHVVGPREVE
jgi:DNA-binding NtrC family response regulator